MKMQRYDAMRREVAQSIRDVCAKLQTGEKNVKIKLWVTLSKAYAEDNAKVYAGYPGWKNGYHIIEQEVPIENVWWYGNDLAEWGYHNGKESKRARIPLLCMWFKYRRYRLHRSDG